MSARVDVAVIARHDLGGKVVPLCVIWETGKSYRIDRVLNVCRCASLKGGGIGTRYTCEIQRKCVYLWDEFGTWFMERKV